jgi:hypothetical protein
MLDIPEATENGAEIALLPSFLLRLSALQSTPATKNNIESSNNLL